MLRRATIRDVAEAAGVSPSTVSRFFGGGYVGDTARARIGEAVTATGYEPNMVARGLKSGRGNFIVLAVPDIGNPFYARMAKVAQALSEENGFVLIVQDCCEDKAREIEAVALAKRVCAAGVLLSTIDSCSHLESVIARSPIALVGMTAYEKPGPFDIVTVGPSGGTDLAVKHLAVLGHKRIFYVGGTKESGIARGRLAGYARQMECEHLPVTPDAIIETGFSQEDGRRAGQAFMARSIRPTAICCANDLLAFGVINALNDLGVKVPEEVSVTGMDDIPFAPITKPRLTTVTNDSAFFAREAFGMLAQRIGGYEGPARQVPVPHRLIVRESTCPPPADT